MATKRFRLVVAETAIQPFAVLYIGDDSAKAEEVFSAAAADEAVLSVRLFVYPSPVKTRYPSTELHQSNNDAGVALRGAQARLEAATTLAKQADEAAMTAAKRKDIAESALKTARKQHEAGQLHIIMLNAKIKDHHEASVALRVAAEQFDRAQSALEKARTELIAIEEQAEPATAEVPSTPSTEPEKVRALEPEEAPDPTEPAKSPEVLEETPAVPSADYVDPAQGAPAETLAESLDTSVPYEKPRHRTRR